MLSAKLDLSRRCCRPPPPRRRICKKTHGFFNNFPIHAQLNCFNPQINMLYIWRLAYVVRSIYFNFQPNRTIFTMFSPQNSQNPSLTRDRLGAIPLNLSVLIFFTNPPPWRRRAAVGAVQNLFYG